MPLEVDGNVGRPLVFNRPLLNAMLPFPNRTGKGGADDCDDCDDCEPLLYDAEEEEPRR